MDRKVAFTESTAKRVGAATLAYERSGRDMPGIRFRMVSGDEGGVLRLCKTACPFPKNSVQTLDVWEEGTPPNETISTGQTIENVVNKYADIEEGKFVSIAPHGNGRWYVVAADCN